VYEKETLQYIKKYKPVLAYFTSLALRKILRPIDQWAAAIADVILANSKYTSKCIWRAYRRKAEVVHTSIDRNVFKPKTPGTAARKKFRIPPNARLLFCPGRLYPQKRVDIAIKTLAILSKGYDTLMLVITGAGPEEQKLKGLTRQLGADEKVKFLGLRSTREIVELYNLAEVVLFPSINEPWGFVALEAMACGKPVVAFKCGGPAESIVHGKTGLLVKEVGSAKAFARAVEYLLDNPKTRARMGKKGRGRSKLFSLENTVSGISDAIARVA
jgi:glycosyltransferase involved in cell wall biosynthesis